MRSLQEEFEALTPKKKKNKKKKKDARAIEHSFTPKNGKLSQHREGIVLLETDLATSPPVSEEQHQKMVNILTEKTNMANTHTCWFCRARGHMYRQCPLRLLEGSNVRRHQETNRARGRGSRAATGAEPAAPAVCSAAAAAPAPLPLLALRPPLAPLAMLRLPPPMAPDISIPELEELNNYDFMSESE
ncbi:hypothetical protein DTO282E5_3142 [Paecilomyces variotii]|nr:hypothetical protein DTO282E5_3142 [Paecilomyces variotii]